MSTKLKYVGGHDGVDVVMPDGSVVTCERNHEIEVDDASTRKSLLAQGDNWTEVKRDSSTSSPSPSATAGKEK